MSKFDGLTKNDVADIVSHAHEKNIREDKAKLRATMSEQEAEYFAKGGTVKVIPRGVSAIPITNPNIYQQGGHVKRGRAIRINNNT